ncbi:MAG TPA: hypothetical protein VF166_06200 [Gemmatimonadaceae bacterium]
MRATRWLVLAAAPAILGLLLVAALVLAESPQSHAARILAAVAIAAAIISALLAWSATRRLAEQLDRLADAARSASSARDDGTRREHAAEAKAGEAMELLRSAVQTIGAQLKDVQLPLHILLASPFGDLNENQEEILAAARGATDEADIQLRQLAKLVELERGDVVIVPQPMNLAELLRPALSIAEARAEKAGVHFRAHISPTAPRVIVDPVHAQEALSALLTEAVADTSPDGEVKVDAADDESLRIRIVVTHDVAPATPSLGSRLARRLIEAQHGQVHEATGQTIIELPHEQLAAVAR